MSYKVKEFNGNHHNQITNNYYYFSIGDLYGPNNGDEIETGDEPIISIWHDDNHFSTHFILPKQNESYDVDVYATDSEGTIFDLTGVGTFEKSEGHSDNFFNISGDDIQAGMLWGEGGVYNKLDITGAEGTYELHVELTGISGDAMHDVSALVVL